MSWVLSYYTGEWPGSIDGRGNKEGKQGENPKFSLNFIYKSKWAKPETF